MRWFVALKHRVSEEWERISGKRAERLHREFEAKAKKFRADMERGLEKIPVVPDEKPVTNGSHKETP